MWLRGRSSRARVRPNKPRTGGCLRLRPTRHGSFRRCRLRTTRRAVDATARTPGQPIKARCRCEAMTKTRSHGSLPHRCLVRRAKEDLDQVGAPLGHQADPVLAGRRFQTDDRLRENPQGRPPTASSSGNTQRRPWAPSSPAQHRPSLPAMGRFRPDTSTCHAACRLGECGGRPNPVRLKTSRSLSDAESPTTPESDVPASPDTEQMLSFPLVYVPTESPQARSSRLSFRSKNRGWRRKPDPWAQAAIEGGHVYPKP
ncbi:unannotated protein [freshwater metagenome]|uniref:Unannotated protein n=1 Tax=freshwater metagenome TaxID=449393 RepID=A0A6J7EZC9_9ZZZZ